MTMIVIFACLCILLFLYHNRKKLLTKIPVLLVGSAVVCVMIWLIFGEVHLSSAVCAGGIVSAIDNLVLIYAGKRNNQT